MCGVRTRLITSGELGFFGELLQFLDHRGAAWKPHRQSRTDVIVQDKNLQFFAELAMVALLRFLQHGEVFVELRLVFKRGAVNALELRILFVAFVVGACHIR